MDLPASQADPTLGSPKPPVSSPAHVELALIRLRVGQAGAQRHHDRAGGVSHAAANGSQHASEQLGEDVDGHGVANALSQLARCHAHL